MTRLQSYLFSQVLGPMVLILAGLTALALLTQGLSQLNLLTESRPAGVDYLKIVLLYAPNLVGLVLPLALFVGTLFALNRLHTEAELAAAYASGASRWHITAPVLRLATLCALLHLALSIIIQPIALRTMRAEVDRIRSDLVATLVREGVFTQPVEGLTFFAGETTAQGRMSNVLIHDGRDPAAPVTYTAARGALAEVLGQPAVVLEKGAIQTRSPNGDIQFLDFNQYVFELGAYLKDNSGYRLKPSDMFLHELLNPDRTDYWVQRGDNLAQMSAEAHFRLAAPLYNLVLALIALIALLGGEYSRTGYGRRMGIAVGLALLARVLPLQLQAAATDNPGLNWVQYAVPLALFVLGLIWLFAPSTARLLRPFRAPPAAPLKSGRPA